jgi:hypothetical protein
VPARRVLNGMEPERILAALDTGTMRTQGAQRTIVEKHAIAAFLTGKIVGDSPAPPAPKMRSTTAAARIRLRSALPEPHAQPRSAVGYASVRRPKKSAASRTAGSSSVNARTDLTRNRAAARSNIVTFIQSAS